jgi:hypothetical protein
VFDDSSIHHVLDESLEDEVFDFSLERINYVDLVGIENFLSNFPNNNLDVGFKVLEDNFFFFFFFLGQESIDPFWEPFMEHELEKINEACVKIDLSQVSVRNFRSTI